MRNRALPLILTLMMTVTVLPTVTLAVTVTEVVPCKYDAIETFSEGLAVVKLDGKWGFVDTTGREVVPCKYSAVNNFSEGFAVVWLYGKCGFIDTTGREVIPLKYDGAEKFSEGLAAVKLDGKWGFVDQTGAEVVPCKYDDVKNFHEGFAAVNIGKDLHEGIVGMWGFVDKTGREVVPCKYNSGKYDDTPVFSEGMAAVCLNEKTGYVDQTGTEVIPCKYAGGRDFSEGLAEVWIEGKDKYGFKEYKFGYIDKTGNVVIPFKYDMTWDFHEGLARAGTRIHYKEENVWATAYGFVDKTGREVVPSGTYSDAEDFDQGFAKVNRSVYALGKNGKWGLIDTTGREVVPCKYNSLGDFYEGLAIVWLDGKEGFIDQTGAEVIPLKYDRARNFSEGLAAVRLDDKWGFIDQTGAEVIPFKYDSAAEFSEGFALVVLDGKAGFIDRTGAEVVPCKYEDAISFDQGVAWVALYEQGFKCGLLAITDSIPAYASSQTVLVDGKEVEFQMYALKDQNGNPTNYVKLRDVASVLNGTAAQFEVGWDKEGVTITTGKPYTPNGSEMSTPFSGDRPYEVPTAQTRVDGSPADLDAIVLTDDRGGQYTYYKLRDLGAALGFRVDWDKEKGVFIETKGTETVASALSADRKTADDPSGGFTALPVAVTAGTVAVGGGGFFLLKRKGR